MLRSADKYATKLGNEENTNSNININSCRNMTNNFTTGGSGIGTIVLSTGTESFRNHNQWKSWKRK